MNARMNRTQLVESINQLYYANEITQRVNWQCNRLSLKFNLALRLRVDFDGQKAVLRTNHRTSDR